VGQSPLGQVRHTRDRYPAAAGVCLAHLQVVELLLYAHMDLLQAVCFGLQCTPQALRWHTYRIMSSAHTALQSHRQGKQPHRMPDLFNAHGWRGWFVWHCILC
jgi:hypothetical protein